MHAFPKPPADLSDPPTPPPPDVIAAAWVARRCRVSPAVAATMRELALLGGLAQRGR